MKGDEIMKKKSLVVFLILLVLLLQSLVVYASETRIEVLGDLRGVIEDEGVDYQLNPAQLYNIEGNKLFFQSYLSSSYDQDEDIYIDENNSIKDYDKTEEDITVLSGGPSAVYQLNNKNKVEVGLTYHNYNSNEIIRNWDKDLKTGVKDFDEEEEEKYKYSYYALDMVDALKVDNNLIVGGQLALAPQKYSEENIVTDKITSNSNSELEDVKASSLFLAGGGIYQINKNNTIDGRISMNKESSNDVDYDANLGDVISLFLRGVKELNQNEKVVTIFKRTSNVGVYPLSKTAYKDSSIELEIGKRDLYQWGLLAYSAELYNSKQNKKLHPDTAEADKETGIRLRWGLEREITDKLMIRLGDQYTIYKKRDEADEDVKTDFQTPKINSVNVGLGYQINEFTKVDISYLPYIDKHKEDYSNGAIDKGSDLELKASVTSSF